MAYREPEPSVRVELRPSGLWLRLRIELTGLGLASQAGWALPVPAALTVAAAFVYRDEPAVVAGIFLLVFLPLFLVRAVPAVFAAASRALLPRAVELDLPRALVFRASGIRVEPPEGEPYERRWPYFHEARRVLPGLELILSREPYLVCSVPRATLRGKDFEQLEAWLVENALLERQASARARP